MIADLPDWVDVHFLRQFSGTLVVAAILLLIVLMFILKSIGTRVIVIVVVAAAVFGLVHYRQTLEHCGKDGCSCTLFGQRVPADNCPDTSG